METKEYSENKDITVLWTPSRCKHAGVCVKTLPKVYHPKDKPWITPTEASVEELKNQIEKCPTGALGYRLNH
ncbi:(4Fe-4S)-binding protein [Elizabethkingia sp. HX WHF]|uniref:(4Fe-4S)-binding protein n=1 Tax=Elizabethkingia bruuniana TaxID=1756149 RepID=A0A7T7UYR1_9FLAO|nr:MULTISPECIES: (4Fe-4S)-binding protein [Elizabethkingia]ATL42386.1 (4Fe-4S)-binding protein [Elizabethkingia miricola]AQX85188.1 (4Fe-4S)-binding protein [Elizabethkingia bruuniana]KGO09518.1 divergent 4Fe-4S mono-cluster [Elizabethkingia miricola]KUY28625.1 (4Fe-4S)-binding protein [Elizabethkingia bruuniana]MCL1638876.1 (4Fe-4S)-binding protein [Elizabethkingia bruuniana]